MKIHFGALLPKHEDKIVINKDTYERSGTINGQSYRVTGRRLQKGAYEAKFLVADTQDTVQIELTPRGIVSKLNTTNKEMTQPLKNEFRLDAETLWDEEKALNRQCYLDVRKAFAGGEKQLQNLCDKYLMNVCAWVRKEPVRDPMTDSQTSVNTQFMEAIESRMGITAATRENFRKELQVRVEHTIAKEKSHFSYKNDPQLEAALEDYSIASNSLNIPISALIETKLSEEQKDIAKHKIDIFLKRLIEMGYNEDSAKAALHRADTYHNPYHSF